MCGINFQRLLIFRERLGGAAQVEVGGPEVRVGVDVFRIELESVLIPRDCLLEHALVEEKVREFERRARVFGISRRLILKVLHLAGDRERRMAWRQCLAGGARLLDAVPLGRGAARWRGGFAGAGSFFRRRGPARGLPRLRRERSRPA